MLEIFLIIFQCKKAKELLTEKGYKAKSIYFSITLTWFTITLLGAGAIAIAYYFIVDDGSDPSWLLCYLPTIPLGFLSSHLILKRIESFPHLESDDEPSFRTPVWHYVVCLLSIIIGFFAILAFIIIVGSEPGDLDAKQREYIDSLNVLSAIGTVGVSSLSGFASFLLIFRLRVGFILYCLAFLIGISYDYYSEGSLFFIPEPFSIGRMIGSVIAYAIPITLIVIWSRWWRRHLN